MENILVSIKGEEVIIFDNGVRNVSQLSDWDGNTKDEILLEYKSLKEGGEIFE